MCRCVLLLVLVDIATEFFALGPRTHVFFLNALLFRTAAVEQHEPLAFTLTSATTSSRVRDVRRPRFFRDSSEVECRCGVASRCCDTVVCDGVVRGKKAVGRGARSGRPLMRGMGNGSAQKGWMCGCSVIRKSARCFCCARGVLDD